MIDFHVHIGHLSRNEDELTGADLIEWMDAQGISKAVVLPVENPEAAEHYSLTEYVIAEYTEYPLRIIPFCAIDPRVSNSSPRTNFYGMIAQYIERGCRGFGEHKPGLAIDDPRSMSIYDACGKLDIPVLMHLDPIRNTDSISITGLRSLEKLLHLFPKTNFIMHATHWWREISAEVDLYASYPKGPIVQGGRVEYLLRKYPNIYGELSAGSGFGAISRDREFGKQFMERNKHKLLFGTDYLQKGQETPIVKYIQEVALSEEAFDAITKSNAERLLKL